MIPTDDLAGEPPVTPPGRKRSKTKLLFAVFLATLIGLVSVAGYSLWAIGGSGSGETVNVQVPEGADAGAIATELARAGVIRSAFMFRTIAKIRGVAGDFKPGIYEMQTGMGVAQAIERLRKGVPLEVFRFTIPEGKTLIEIASIVGEKTPVTAEEFLAAARSGRHTSDLLPEGSKNLEGLLFPDTYDVDKGTTADGIIEVLLGEFRRRTADLDFSKARALGVTPYEAVIIASLIEREAKVQKDRPLVSSVIYNRLRKPMRLQIDATIQYALLMKTGSYKPALSFKDLEIDSPYNTYRIDGLPPGPIASPGITALRAALDPAESPYFYYVLTRDGVSHCFGRTLSEHERCMRER